VMSKRIARKPQANVRKQPAQPVSQKGRVQRKQRKQVKRPLTMSIVNDKSSISTVNAQPTITIYLALSPGAIWGVVQQYLSMASSRGFLATASSGDPYFAAVYMVNVILAFARGAVPAAATVPKWLLNLGRAIAPKTVPLGTGFVRYAFNTDAFPTVYTPASNSPIGSGVYGYEYLLWSLGTTTTDLFPNAVAPGGYTDAAGIRAWSLLTTFMVDEKNPNTMMVPVTSKTPFDTNVSAFAFAQEGRGLGAGVDFSLAVVLGLEVPVHTPCLGTFVAPSAEFIPLSRYSRFNITWSGDAMATSLMFNALCHSTKSLGFKRNLRLKYLDFNEFLDVLALYVSALQTQAMRTPGGPVTISPASLICPLSLQEVGLLFRNEMMTAFADSQSATQASYPRFPNAVTDNEFVPFVMSTTTAPLQSTAMRLPIYLVENLKCLKGRPVIGKNKRGQRKLQTIYLPVVGQYYSDQLDQANYTYPDGDGGFLPSFTTLASVMRRKRRENKDSTVKFAPEVEAPISYIDGSSGINYVFINDLTRLTALALLWNNWITQFSAYSISLSVMSGDYGPSALCSIGTTRHWALASEAYKQRVADVEDDRLINATLSTAYADKQAVVTTTHDPMIDGVVKTALNLWVLPQNWSKSGPTLPNSTFFTNLQIITEEPFSLASTSGDNGSSLAQLHSTYAASMVKGVASDKPVLEEFLLNAEKTGHGGILSSLLAEAAGKFLGPAVGDVAKTVANIIPI